MCSQYFKVFPYPGMPSPNTCFKIQMKWNRLSEAFLAVTFRMGELPRIRQEAAAPDGLGELPISEENKS